MRKIIFILIFSIIICSITSSVSAADSIEVTSFKIEAPQVMFSKDKNNKITISAIKPSNATNKRMKYSVNNTNIASISSDGKITIKGTGVIEITVTASDKKGLSKKVKCWCFDSNNTLDNVLVGKIDDLKTMNFLGTGSVKAAAFLCYGYEYLQYVKNKRVPTMEGSAEKKSYCLSCSNQVCGVVAKRYEAGYYCYGYIHVDGHDCLTCIDSSLLFPASITDTGEIAAAFSKAFGSSFSIYSFSGMDLANELVSISNQF